MANQLERALETLEAHLTSAEALPLQAGLSPDTIDHLLAHRFSGRIPPELQTLYRWHNGATTTRPEGGWHGLLAPDAPFLPLEQMLANKDEWDKIGRVVINAAEHDNAQLPIWLPIFMEQKSGWVAEYDGGRARYFLTDAEDGWRPHGPGPFPTLHSLIEHFKSNWANRTYVTSDEGLVFHQTDVRQSFWRGGYRTSTHVAE